MSFQPQVLFPGLLSDSALRLAQTEAKPAAARIVELGWNSVLVPESHGGAGGGFSDLAAIIESLASQAIDLPVISRCGTVPTLLACLSGQPAADALLRQIAEGKAVAELGGPLHHGDPTSALRARCDASGWRLSGHTTVFALTDDCTHVLLVARRTEDDAWLIAAVPSSGLRKRIKNLQTMDDRMGCVCELEDLAVPASQILAEGEHARRALGAAWRVAQAAAAVDTVACMGASLALTIAYLLEREQFGQKLAQFQALRHEVARLYICYEMIRNLLQASLPSLDDPAAIAAFDLLSLHVGQESVPFAESVIQLHGGMGMTREMKAAQLATRMIANSMHYGDPLMHRQRLHALREKETV